MDEAARDRRYRAAVLGAAGGVTSARRLSRLYAWLLEAFTVETIGDILRPETEGSTGFADPERRVAFGYAMTRMLLGPHDDRRATALVRALYDSLA